ncbi:unnamed protein product [Arctogadus glacialis]
MNGSGAQERFRAPGQDFIKINTHQAHDAHTARLMHYRASVSAPTYTKHAAAPPRRAAVLHHSASPSGRAAVLLHSAPQEKGGIAALRSAPQESGGKCSGRMTLKQI